MVLTIVQYKLLNYYNNHIFSYEKKSDSKPLKSRPLKKIMLVLDCSKTDNYTVSIHFSLDPP